MNKAYTVRPDGGGTYVIIDVTTGAHVNRFNIPGDLVNGPIVSGDSCTIVTKTSNLNTGYVIKIPTGYMINRFSA
jgi:hypothetical protein